METKFIALGSAHWDILGRSDQDMALHDDVGGRIRRLIGGVAGPISMKLASSGACVELICYAGNDAFGAALLAKLDEFSVGTKHSIRGNSPTDAYMGVEASNGLIAAIADCQSLEAESHKIVDKFARISDAQTQVLIDGNLHENALINLSQDKTPYALRTLVPASPDKILRFRHFIGSSKTQLALNLREASLLADRTFDTTIQAAQALAEMGFSSALVTDGENPVSFANGIKAVSQLPPQVKVKRFTGAGDTLAAHFILGQAQGLDPNLALQKALNATSEFISKEDLDA